MSPLSADDAEVYRVMVGGGGVAPAPRGKKGVGVGATPALRAKTVIIYANLCNSLQYFGRSLRSAANTLVQLLRCPGVFLQLLHRALPDRA